MRNKTIDVLRTMGLLLVISAHVFYDLTYKNIRTFDVVMLVFIAGMSFSYNKIDFSFKSGTKYILHRARQLLIPTWGYLIFHFLFFTIIGWRFVLHTIISSFALIDGLGYVWIVRIYLTIAILSPLFKKIVNKLNGYKFILFIVILLLANEGIYFFINNCITNVLVSKICSYLVTFTLGYMIAFWVGQKWLNLKKRDKFLLFGFNLMIFIVCILKVGKFDIQVYKNPPQLIYLTYGLVCSMILYESFDKVRISNELFMKVVTWISKNSMNIYLWHIFAINILAFYNITIKNVYLNYIIIVGMSCLITLIVNDLFKKGRMIICEAKK